MALLLLAQSASAHVLGLSSGEYEVKRGALHAKLSFARAEVAALAPALDADRDGHVTAHEVAAARTLLDEKILRRVRVQPARLGASRCTGTLIDAAVTEQDGLFVEGTFACAERGDGFEVALELLDDLAPGHRHVARSVAGDRIHDEVLSGEHRSLRIPPGPAEDGGTNAPSRSLDTASVAVVAWSFFTMGVEHIVTGYDHLLFLLAVVLARGRLRSFVRVVTAFTVAHSATLALAALDIWTPSPRVVEPAIALSIAFVGVENFFVDDASRRWRVTFAFGLVHGFGFAGALREASIPVGDVGTALVSFNAGVEAGQLAALALVLPLLSVLRRTRWFEPRVARLVSGVVAVVGVVLFAKRLAFD